MDNHSIYRDSLRDSLSLWPEFAWLVRFLQTPAPRDATKTTVRVLDFVDGQITTQQPAESCADLKAQLMRKVQDGSTRLFVLAHTDSWSVNRDMVDLLATQFDIDPRTLADHFDYSTIRFEERCPADLKEAIRNVNDDGYEHKYSWSLGGILSSPFQLYDSRSTILSYGHIACTLLLQSNKENASVLVLLREGAKHQTAYELDYSIFWPGIPCQPLQSQGMLGVNRIQLLVDYLLHRLSCLYPQVFDTGDHIYNGLVSMISECLASCAYGRLQRDISPAALDRLGLYRFDEETLFREMRDVQKLMRQVAALNPRQRTSLAQSRLHNVIEVLKGIGQDLQQLLDCQRSQNDDSGNDFIGQLLQDQTAESKASLSTSIQVGRLTRLAYIFLPLQLTTSFFGMNLTAFGSGTLPFNIILAVFCGLCFLSYLPLILPLLRLSTGIDRAWSACSYSRRVGFLYILFHLTHTRSLSGELWSQCGFANDILHYQGKGGKRDILADGWKANRVSLLLKVKENRWSLFPQFWTPKLDEMFDIIDRPRWGEIKEHNP